MMCVELSLKTLYSRAERLFCILFLSSASAVFSVPSLKNKTQEVLQESGGESGPKALDAWGRPVDEISSADAFDVQE